MYVFSFKNINSTRSELVACFTKGAEEVSISTGIGYVGDMLDINVFHVAI